MYLLRRLITSDEDTSASMAILLGPTWQNAADILRQCCVYVLKSPLQDSSAAMMEGAMDEESIR